MPRPEQDQIGKRPRPARPMLPGRLLEAAGNRRPRGMTAARAARSGRQNPAYGRLPLFFVLFTTAQEDIDMPTSTGYSTLELFLASTTTILGTYTAYLKLIHQKRISKKSTKNKSLIKSTLTKILSRYYLNKKYFLAIPSQTNLVACYYSSTVDLLKTQDQFIRYGLSWTFPSRPSRTQIFHTDIYITNTTIENSKKITLYFNATVSVETRGDGNEFSFDPLGPEEKLHISVLSEQQNIEFTIKDGNTDITKCKLDKDNIGHLLF